MWVLVPQGNSQGPIQQRDASPARRPRRRIENTPSARLRGLPAHLDLICVVGAVQGLQQGGGGGECRAPPLGDMLPGAQGPSNPDWPGPVPHPRKRGHQPSGHRMQHGGGQLGGAVHDAHLSKSSSSRQCRANVDPLNVNVYTKGVEGKSDDSYRTRLMHLSEMPATQSSGRELGMLGDQSCAAPSCM